MIPIIFDKSEPNKSNPFTSNGLGRLKDCISCNVDKSLDGGQYDLEMEYPVEGMHYEDIVEKNYILASTGRKSSKQPFRITKVSRPINGTVTVSAQHISYILKKTLIRPYLGATAIEASTRFRIDQGESLATVLERVHNYIQPSKNDKFTFVTDVTVPAGRGYNPYTEEWYELSEWGNATNPNTGKPCWEIDQPLSVLEFLTGSGTNSINGIWGFKEEDNTQLEYSFDGFTIGLFKRVGAESGISVRYAKDVTDLTYDRDETETYTSCIAYWSGDRTATTIISPVVTVNEDVGDAFGEMEVIDLSSDTTYQYYLDKNGTVANPTNAADWARQKLEDDEAWIIKESLSVSFIDLWETEEYMDVAPIQKLDIGDTLTVIYPSIGVHVTKRIQNENWDVLVDRYKSVTLGDLREKDLKDVIVEDVEQYLGAMTEYVENTFTYYGTEINRNAQEIELRAYKTTVTELGNTVSEHTTLISNNADAITLEAKAREDGDSDLDTKITVQAGRITSEINDRKTEDESLSSRITQNATTISTEVKNLKDADTSLSSRITQNANAITSEVSDRQTAIYSVIKQLPDSISLSVSSSGNTAGITISIKDGNGDTITSNQGNITITGFVTFNDLSGNGTTTINGSNIKTGSISAIDISGSTITGSSIKTSTTNGKYLYMHDAYLDIYYSNTHTAFLRGSYWSGNYTGSKNYGASFNATSNGAYIGFGNVNADGTNSSTTQLMINNGLNPNGYTENVIVFGSLRSTGSAIFGGNTTVSGTFASTGGCTLGGNTSVTGTLQTTGSCILGGDTSINGNIKWSPSYTTAGNINIGQGAGNVNATFSRNASYSATVNSSGNIATPAYVEAAYEACKNWVSGQGYLTSHQSLTNYATKTWVENQGYLTSHQSLSGYVNAITNGTSGSTYDSGTHIYTTGLAKSGSTISSNRNSFKLSDERLKENIKPLQDFTKVYMRLRPVEFNYKWYNLPCTDSLTYYGIIAQELQKICEEEGVSLYHTALLDPQKPAEGTNEDYYVGANGRVLTVDKENLHALHIQMIQKQQYEIEQLTMENVKLQGEINILKQRFEEFKMEIINQLKEGIQ